MKSGNKLSLSPIKIVPVPNNETIRYSVNKGKPYGTDTWIDNIVEKFNLGHTLRGPGRPKGS